MKLLILIAVSFIAGTQAQCQTGSIPLTGSTCFDTTICNGCEGNLCCGPTPTGATSPSTSSGCIGPCFDSACPTGYTCNTATQECCLSTNSSTGTCRDRVGPRGFSDCPSRAYLCSNTVYYDLMSSQCPKTCGRCNNSTTSTNITGSTGSANCVDLTRPDGISDCPTLSYLCENSAYRTLMTQQCPKTCGRCNSRSSNRSSSSSSSEED